MQMKTDDTIHYRPILGCRAAASRGRGVALDQIAARNAKRRAIFYQRWYGQAPALLQTWDGGQP